MRKQGRGLSLIELVISTLIAAVLLFSVFQLLTSGANYQLRSRTATKISTLARKAVEKARITAMKATAPLADESAFFVAPYDDFAYTIHYYTYRTVPLPSVSGSPDPVNNRYLVALEAVVEGPMESTGVGRPGYMKTTLLAIVANKAYISDTPIAPAYPGVPAPAPTDPIIMPSPPTPADPIITPSPPTQ